MAKIKKRLYDYEANFLNLNIKPNDKGRKQATYSITENDWDEIVSLRSTPKERQFVEVSKRLNKEGEVLSTVEKLQSEPIEVPENFELAKVSTSKTTGQQWLQYLPKKEQESIKEIDFESIVKKYINKIPLSIDPLPNSGYFFDRTVYTDTHIGMTPNENGFSLYGGKWDEDEIMDRSGTIASHTLEHQKSDILILDDLGDLMDGYDGETVRKGHKLPQNMDNETAFDIAIKFKVSQIDTLAPKYKKIICNNICNDNHAGSFGYIVNSAFKSIIEARYDNVTVNNHRSFISHYFMGNKCFIITHGKDGKNLKFGFKPILDAKQIEKIESYIKHHKLYEYDIEFSKGDSHQFIFDYSTSDAFDYCNYPALSPSSEWVQTNYKKGTSGFVAFNYKENGDKSEHPYFFDWKNTNEEKSIDWASIAL